MQSICKYFFISMLICMRHDQAKEIVFVLKSIAFSIKMDLIVFISDISVKLVRFQMIMVHFIVLSIKTTNKRIELHSSFTLENYLLIGQNECFFHSLNQSEKV